MRGVTVHGIFLAVMLLLAYQAWLPNETRSSDPEGSITIWEFSPSELRAITYVRAGRTTVIERRDEQEDSYLWGSWFDESPRESSVDTTAGADELLIETRNQSQTNEFPIGEQGENTWERLAHLTALRDLGVLDDAAKERYELSNPERRLTVSTADSEQTLEVGGTVYRASHRYALDPVSGRGYVLADRIVRPLEGGSSSLRLRTLHRFDEEDVATVTVRAPSGERTMRRRAAATGGEDVWVSPDTPEQPNQTFKNFMDHVEQLVFLRVESTANVDTMQLLVRIDYTDEADAPIGFLEMYRVATAQPGMGEYYLQTEATRVPTVAHRSFAERVDRDLADLF